MKHTETIEALRAQLRAVQAEFAALKLELEQAILACDEAPPTTLDQRVYYDEILPIFMAFKAMRDGQKMNSSNRKKLERVADDKLWAFLNK